MVLLVILGACGWVAILLLVLGLCATAHDADVPGLVLPSPDAPLPVTPQSARRRGGHGHRRRRAPVGCS
jgi:hypothetical protein